MDCYIILGGPGVTHKLTIFTVLPVTSFTTVRCYPYVIRASLDFRVGRCLYTDILHRMFNRMLFTYIFRIFYNIMK